MKHLLSRVLALVVTLSISMGSAALWTGNDLLQICADEDDHFKFTRCMAYINGANDSHVLTQTLNKLDSFYCIPEKVTLGQTAKVVSKYLENHPEVLHERAVDHVFVALMRAFPCKSPREPVNTP
jgi:hypothetical protein